ncbi:hypothetical protein [Kribbella sp. NPDC006257]|uniref:hypothetical protein n=1 Tax=Kribbella sp. NPDC006257 TaxID=3156738 RepID=UPI0033A7ABE9
MLWFGGNKRLVADYQAVERAARRALVDPDVLAAAGFESIELVAGTSNLYDAKPLKGEPFRFRVRAAFVEGGHPGEFVVRADGTEAASITLSFRIADAGVGRTLVNLLHQIDHAGRPSEIPQPGRPAVESKLRAGSNVRDDLTLTREDGGRLAELRYLDLQDQHIPQYRAVRRADVLNEMRALLEHMAVAHGQTDAEYRRALLGADRDLVARRTDGWKAGDERPRGRVYVGREMVGVATTAGASVGIVLGSNSLIAGLGLAVPALITAFVHAHQQRKLDAEKQAVKGEQYGEHLGEVTKRNTGVYELIESDPFGIRASPPAEIDPAKLAPPRKRYLARHLIPSTIGLSVSTLITGISPAALAPTLFYAASALIRPITDRMADALGNKKEMLRFEELMTRVATDPERYENQLIDFLQQLQERLRAATTAISRMSRTDEALGSLEQRTLLGKELAEQVPGYLKRVVPAAPEPNEADPTELSELISSYGESLIFGAISGLAGAATSAWVNAFLQRQSDAAVAELFQFSLELRDSANSNALHEAMTAEITKTIALVELAERLAAGPADAAQAKLLDRIFDRFRQSVPAPPAPLDAAQRPDGLTSVWAQTLTVVPPAVQLGVLEISNIVLGLGPVAHIATAIAATVQLLVGPVARILGNREDLKHGTHAMDANNELAVEPQVVADKVAAVRFVHESIQSGAQVNPARTVELLFRIRPSSPGYTDRVRAAVRAARLTIQGDPQQGFQQRQDLHQALDRIEQQADQLDDLAAAARRNEAGARAELRRARAVLAAVLKSHQPVDGQGALPGLTDVDPAAGHRTEGDPLIRAQARTEEGWRRLHGEPTSTPLRVQRLIALNRVRQALRTLANHLAFLDARTPTDGVEHALDEFRTELAKFKELQQKAGVPGDLDFDPTAVADQVHQHLAPRRPDGNAAKLRHFLADGIRQIPRKLLPKIVAELENSLLHEFADVRSIEVRPGEVRSGVTVVVTTHNGDELVIRFVVGEVADGHPGEFWLTEGGKNPVTGEPEHAVVRISDRINDHDIGRAVVHELRELSHLEVAGDGAAFSPHQQGRLGELLQLHDALTRSEADFSGDRELKRRLTAAKFRELADELSLDHPDIEQRLQRLKDHAEVRRALDAHRQLLEEFGNQAPTADPVVVSHRDLVAFQHELREHLRGEAERNGTSLDHEYHQFALRQVMARTLQHSPGAWTMNDGKPLLTGFPGAHQSQMVEALQAALRLDLGDHLRFELSEIRPLREQAGARLIHDVYLGDQLIGRVSVYLVPHTQPVDWTPGDPDFGVSPRNGFDPAFHYRPIGDAFVPGVHDPDGAFKGNERPIAEKLARERGWRLDGRLEDHGVEHQKDPECMVRKGPDDPGRIVEFKTLDPPANKDANPQSALKRNIIDASRQVPPDGEIVIDARRVPGLTEEDAGRAFRRALGQGNSRVAAQVHVILDDGRIVTFVKER